MIRSWSLKLVLRFNWPWGCVNTESNFDWPPPVEVLAFCQQVTDKQTDQHFRIITRSTLSSMDYSPSLHCPNNLIPEIFQCLWTRRYLHCVLSLSHNKSPHRNTIMLKSHLSWVQHFLAGCALWKKLNKPGVLGESAALVCKWPLITQYITSQYLKVWNKPHYIACIPGQSRALSEVFGPAIWLEQSSDQWTVGRGAAIIHLSQTQSTLEPTTKQQATVKWSVRGSPSHATSGLNIAYFLWKPAWMAHCLAPQRNQSWFS